MSILCDLTPRPSLAESFAVEDHLPPTASPRLRLWCHRSALVTASRDARLTNFAEAARTFSDQGWEVWQRSSGGSLVVLDEGVLNVSLTWAGEVLPSLEQAFFDLHSVLVDTLAGLGLGPPQKGEVRGSLCPGPGDLALDRRKLAGLSQRRRRQLVLAHAFVLVSGRADDRLAVGRAFYQLAGRADAVQLGTMQTVSEALGRPFAVAEVARRIRLAALERLPELAGAGDI